MQGHDAVAAVHFDDGYAHFDGQQQRRRACEQSQDQQHTTEGLEHTCDVDQLSRQSMLDEHALHCRGGTRELGITVGEENQAQGGAKNQQGERLERSKKFHGHLIGISAIFCARASHSSKSSARRVAAGGHQANQVEFRFALRRWTVG